MKQALQIGATKERAGDLPGADASYRLAIDIAGRRQAMDVPLALLWQAGFLRRHGRVPEARVLAERALQLFLQELGPDHPSTAVAYSALGSMEHAVRDYAAAGPHLQAVLDAYGRDPRKEREPEVWVAAWNLALELREDLRYAEAERALRLAIEIKDRLQPREGRWLAVMYERLAILRGLQGDVEDGVAFYDRAVAEAEALPAEDVPVLAAVLAGQSQQLWSWGKQDAALRAAERALVAHQRAARPDQASITRLHTFLANAALARGQTAEADKHFLAILDNYGRDPGGVGAGFAALSAGRLAESLRAARRYGEAETMARRALDLRIQDKRGDRIGIARAHHLLGLILFAENKLPEGAAENQTAIELYKASPGASLDELINMYNGLGDAYFNAGRYAQSEEPLRQALELASSRGDPVRMTVLQERLSQTYRYLERYAEAEAVARQALAVRRDKMPEDGSFMADALYQLAATLRAQRKYAEAEPLQRQALELREKADGPDARLVLSDRNGLALCLDGLGRTSEAEALYRRTLADRERVLGADHEEVADTIVNLVWNLRKQSRYAEAAELAERPVAIYRKAVGPDHPYVVRGLLPLATIRQDRGEFDEADRLLHEALRIYLATYGADHLKVAERYGSLVELAGRRRQFEEGTGYAEKMLAIVQASYGREDPRLIPALNTVATFHILSGDFDAPEEMFKRALAISERADGPESVAVGFASLNLAYLYRLRGRFGDVEAYYERPLRIFEKSLGPNHWAVAVALQYRAAFDVATGQAGAAEASYDRALHIYAVAFGADSPARATPLANKALLLVQLGRQDEAERLLEKAIALLRKGAGPQTPALATALANLGLLYRSSGRLDEAKVLETEAVGIFRSLYGPDHVPPLVLAPLLAPPPKEI